MTTDTATPAPRFDLDGLTGTSGSQAYPGKVLVSQGTAVEIGAGWTAGHFEITRDDGDQKIAWVEGTLVAYTPGTNIQMVSKKPESRRPLTPDDIGTKVSVNLSSGGAKARLSEFNRKQGDYPDGSVVFAQGEQQIVRNDDGSVRTGTPPYQTGMMVGGVPVPAGDSGLPDIPDLPAMVAAMVRDGSAPSAPVETSTPAAAQTPEYVPGPSSTVDEAAASIRAAAADGAFKQHLMQTIKFCKDNGLVDTAKVPEMDTASLSNLWDALYGVPPAFTAAAPTGDDEDTDEEPF